MSNAAEDPSAMPSLNSYLSRIRSVICNVSLVSTPAAPTSSPPTSLTPRRATMVMGNQSADLDSFISAVVFAYFYNSYGRKPAASTGGIYVPVLNLPHVKAEDLWRLRPEFGVAVRLATADPGAGPGSGPCREVKEEAESEAESQGRNQTALRELVTVADIKDHQKSILYAALAPTGAVVDGKAYGDRAKQELVLVDHNVPSMSGLSDEDVRQRFRVVGCVDHHIDEGFVASDAKPRIIRTGIGSCTSLVVKHLRDEGLWPLPGAAGVTDKDVREVKEMAKLALAPILMDTVNLTAAGDKCSDTDRAMVAFLEAYITGGGVGEDESRWDREAFFHTLWKTKSNSLELLTMQEILDRDYKEWIEQTRSGTNVRIGISSLVKPVSWLIKHAEGVGKLLNEIERFANAERELGVYGMLMSTAEGKKEDVVIAFKEEATDAIKVFEESAQELKLTAWEDETFIDAMNEKLRNVADGRPAWKIWWMGDTSKSRKQVGPLLREAVKSI